MNHIQLYASFVMTQCRRFIAFRVSSLRGRASTAQILSYQQLVDKLVQKITSRLQHAQVIHMFDKPGTLQARAHQGLTPGRRRVARGVAFVIGISMSMPMSAADSGSIEALSPKQFIRFSMPKKEAVCLVKLYGKESAFNSLAIGNLKGKIQTYGIPQLKNPIIKDKSPIDQVRYGIKYIDHRYQGDTCKAWAHWMKRGWH